MNVALVVPNFRWIEGSENFMWDYIPYNLCILASTLTDKGYSVKIIDAYKKNMTYTTFMYSLKEADPDYVGITCMMDHYGEALHLAAEYTKRVSPGTHVIVGGVYPTINPHKCRADSNIDIVIVGEGEHALVNTIARNCEVGTKIVRGSFKRPLDELPRPAYHLLPLQDYINSWSRPSVDRPPALPYARIITSRGCPYRCNFCQVHSIVPDYKVRSAENILEEMHWLARKHKIKSWVFDDDNLLEDRERAIKLFLGMKRLNLNYPWTSIATPIFKVDSEMLTYMKDSGCIYVDYAIESGCERVLKEVIHKPVNLGQAYNIVGLTRAIGIYTVCNFIIGFPTETWIEIRESLRVADEIGADYVKISTATPLRQTELWSQCEQLGCFKDGFTEKDMWLTGQIETAEFSAKSLTVLRAYEWDRINFSSEEKRKKTAERMGISLNQLAEIRKSTLEKVRGN